MKVIYTRSMCSACEEAKTFTPDAEIRDVGPGSGHLGTMARLEMMSALAMNDISLDNEIGLPVMVEDDRPYKWDGPVDGWTLMLPDRKEMPEPL